MTGVSDSSSGVKWLVDRLPVPHHKVSRQLQDNRGCEERHRRAEQVIEDRETTLNTKHVKKDWLKRQYILLRQQELDILDFCRMLLLCRSSSHTVWFIYFMLFLFNILYI